MERRSARLNYQFTIQHNEINYFPDNIPIPILTLADTSNWKLLPHFAYCSSEDSIQFLRKDYQFINNRAFIITAFIVEKGPITNKRSVIVVANTTIKNRDYLNFIAECSASDTTGFIDNMYKAISSIQIEEKL